MADVSLSVLCKPHKIALKLCTITPAPVCSLDLCRIDILSLFGFRGFATCLLIGGHVNGFLCHLIGAPIYEFLETLRLGTGTQRAHSIQGRMTLVFECVSLFIYEFVTFEVCTVCERTHSFWMLDDVHFLGIRIEKKMAIS